MNNIEKKKVDKIFKKILKSKIHKKLSIDNCVEWDSLNIAKLLSATEKEFNINYSSNEIEKLTSLENFKKIISSKKKKNK